MTNNLIIRTKWKDSTPQPPRYTLDTLNTELPRDIW